MHYNFNIVHCWLHCPCHNKHNNTTCNLSVLYWTPYFVNVMLKRLMHKPICVCCLCHSNCRPGGNRAVWVDDHVHGWRWTQHRNASSIRCQNYGRVSWYWLLGNIYCCVYSTCIYVLHDSHDICQLFPKVTTTNHSINHLVFEMEKTHRTRLVLSVMQELNFECTV